MLAFGVPERWRFFDPLNLPPAPPFSPAEVPVSDFRTVGR